MRRPHISYQLCTEEMIELESARRCRAGRAPRHARRGASNASAGCAIGRLDVSRRFRPRPSKLAGSEADLRDFGYVEGGNSACAERYARSDGQPMRNGLGSNTLDKNLGTNTIFLRKRMLGPRARLHRLKGGINKCATRYTRRLG